MATRKPDDALALPPLPELPKRQGMNDLTLRLPDNLTPRHRRMIDEFDSQLLALEAQYRKAIVGRNYIADLHTSAATQFVKTAQDIWAARQGTRDPELQGIIDRFTIRLLAMDQIYMEEATRAGADAIITEIGRAIYQSARHRPSRLRERWNGKGDEVEY